MPQIIAEKCAYDEPELLKTTVSRLKNKLKASESSQQQSTATIARLETDMKTLKSQTESLQTQVQNEESQCKNQLDYIQELHQKLESQWNETFIARTEELQKNYQLKLEENGELLEKLQEKEQEINEKKVKLEALEKKVEMLTQY